MYTSNKNIYVDDIKCMIEKKDVFILLVEEKIIM